MIKKNPKPTKAGWARKEFADVDEFRELIPEVDGSVVQLDRGDLKVDVSELNFEDVSIQRLRTNQAISIESWVPRPWTSFVVCPAQIPGDVRWCGVPVAADTLGIVRPNREHHYKLTSGWHDIMIHVSDDLLIESGIVPERLLTRAMSVERGHLQMPSVAASRLRELIFRITDCDATVGAAQTDEGFAQSIRQSILDALADAVRSTLGRADATNGLKIPRRYPLFRRALEHVSRRKGEILTVNELSDNFGATTRAMQRAFQDVLGISPYQFLIRLRLCSARSELIRNGRRLTVATIAANHDFSSGSEFASHYKRFFGESPSSTIKRFSQPSRRSEGQ